MSTTQLNEADVNRLVIEAFTSGWMTYTPKYQYVFTEMDPQRFDEKFSITASGGYIPAVAQGASFPQVDISQVGLKTLSQVDYKESLPITTLLRRFDNYGVVMEEASKLGYRARLTMDKIGADVLNNAFSTETVWDGLPIYDASHQIGNTGFTQSNLFTGPLSETLLNNMQSGLRLQKDQNNQPMALLPRTLVVPTINAKKAFELTASQGSPESANRNSNFFNTLGMDVVVWELLTCTTATYMFSEKLFNRFRYLTSINPTIDYVRIPSNGNYEYQLEFATVAGAADYLGTVASQS